MKHKTPRMGVNIPIEERPPKELNKHLRRKFVGTPEFSPYSYRTAGLDQLQAPRPKSNYLAKRKRWSRKKFHVAKPKGPNGTWTEEQTRHFRSRVVRGQPTSKGVPGRKVSLAKVSIPDDDSFS